MTIRKTIYLTQPGFTKLQEKLSYLCAVRRIEVAEYLHETADGGDTLDNTEHIFALYEQLLLETEISELRKLLADSQLIEPGAANGQVQLGSTVTIQDSKQQLETYTIVGPFEVDPDEGRISYESPLGSALLSSQVGDKIEVYTPSGVQYYFVISVS